MAETDTATSSITLLPFADNALLKLAQRVISDHRTLLPDLSTVTILVADTQAAPQLRRHLLNEAATLGHRALLGPSITSRDDWLASLPLPHPVLGQHGQELLLVEALREHQHLFGSGSLWSLADALLELFDELTLNHVGLPESLNHFRHRIARGYGTTELNHSGLEMETQLVYTLWHAWHSQLRESGQIDRATATVLRLRASLDVPHPGPLYLLGMSGANRAELEWLRHLQERGGLALFLQGEFSVGEEQESYLPDGWLREIFDNLDTSPYFVQRAATPRNHLLHQVYGRSSLSMRDRAAQIAQSYPTSLLQNELEVFSADSSEHEARAVETQVRLWLQQGKRSIGIVTENRRLARRVRALLERAGIGINDSAGWALSTTSAAAVLERWLECVEEDFPWRPLLDLLKSPFFAPPTERPSHLAVVYRLEQQIIHQGQIGSGLERYRQQVAERQKLLGIGQNDEALTEVLQLLERLKLASQWLTPCTSGGNIEAAKILDLLQASLREVGLLDPLAIDSAGQRLLDELEQMRAASTAGNHLMDWQDFRTWLGRTLERFNFQPSADSQSVCLMSLAQSTMQRFDALIIAGVEQEYLPGSNINSPFFNDQVRRELGLMTRDRQMARRFHQFRQLLEAAPVLLITRRREENGEEIPPSPWLELLTSFHQLTWGEPPRAETLARILENPLSEVARRDAVLPVVEGMPTPHLNPPLIPRTLTASAYQQLINCPYQFFSAQGLRLAPPEAIREALAKADYGQKIHLCLQAFHEGADTLPGPFTSILSETTRQEAIEFISAIAERAFLDGTGNQFEQRGWLKRWQQLIPAYIDWQLEREKGWRTIKHEVKYLRDDVIEQLTLKGRLDRIDQGNKGIGVVDYKTGRVARKEEVVEGESVQLPFYALLANRPDTPVAQVELLRLDEGKVSSPLILEGEELTTVCVDNTNRLATLTLQLYEGARLPAWGDEVTCNYCDMEGVCRRQTWPI